MRFWQALVLGAVSVLSWGVAANAQPALHAVVCATGQVTSKAHPCTTPAPKAVSTTSSTPVQIDPGDTGARLGSTDAVTIIRTVNPMTGTYQLELQNTSAIGYINTFNWVAPPGMTITAITGSSGGKCNLANNVIMCTAASKGLTPPTCTCLAGGSMTVNFSSSGNLPTFNGRIWTYYGVVGSQTQITSVTPVPYHIPSFLAPTNLDEPACKKGQTSTDTKPCYT